MIQTIKRKLSRKILTILTLALPLPMLAITYLSATFHIRDSIQHMTQIGNNLATVIYSGIKYPMSVGDQDAVSKQLLDIQIPEVEIFICDEKQVITYANRKNLIGMAVDDTIYDQRRWRQLQEDTTEKLVRQTAFEEKINHKNYLVIVQGITNQPECTHCHGTSQVILGSMVVRLGTDQTYSAIRAIISRNIMITIAGIFAITLAVYIMLAKLVASPIKKLADGMRDLPQRITEGNVGKIATTNREDEIGHLENTFMQMAEKLKEKRQLIERTNLELAAANKDLESFAYSVSHDLRAPLRNIEGFAKILLDECVGKLDEKCQHYLTRVRDGTLRMAQLIDDILNFSRTGRQELEIREINMPALLADVIIDFKEDIDKQGVKLTVHELPNTHGDANMLQRHQIHPQDC
jgi:signal transduction histidine kinase